jgi:hypothetical protein
MHTQHGKVHVVTPSLSVHGSGSIWASRNGRLRHLQSRSTEYCYHNTLAITTRKSRTNTLKTLSAHRPTKN